MSKPNIILINCDDMGYGDLGCYGSGVNQTPNIDRLAAQGLRATSWYAPSPVCSPSRGAMMTGCYPPRIGFGDFDGCTVLFPGHAIGLNPKEKTIASVLRESGYRTMLIGKWHCGDQPEFLPLSHGFDDYFGLPYSNDMGRQAGHPENSPIGLPYPPLPLICGDDITQQQPDQSSLNERYTERAVAFIKGNKGRPFFLYFAHMHVHLPHYAPEAFVRRSQNGVFGACMELVDWSVAVIHKTLEDLGLLENTLIVFTSDNGSRADHGASNAPLRGRKGTTWEGGQRVPCIWYWKNRIAPRTSDEVMSHIDLFSTFTALSGSDYNPERKIDSRDVSPVIFEGQKRPAEENMFYYYWMNNLEAVRLGDWKLHLAKHGPQGRFEINELYNLRDDPGEENSLYEKHSEIVRGFEEHILRARADLGDARLGITGTGTRPAGRVKNPRLLTKYDENHPYIIAMYDSRDSG